MIIANFVCIPLSFNTIKVQLFSLITNFLSNYNSSNSRKLQLSVENYPELKANEQFHRLQNSIEDMELQLQAIRRTYNAAVTDYNNTIEMFPSSVVARQQGHHQEELIDIPEPEQQNVNVAELLR